MKKKLRKLLKKNFIQLKNAFSMVEIAVSLIVIAVIVAALTPIITKRLTASSTIKSRISTNCDSLYTNGYCAMCYLTPKQCIVCTIPCTTGSSSNNWAGQVKNNDDCVCESCTKHDANCANCTLQRCTQCKPGYYLDSANNKCITCPVGKYCSDGTTAQPCAKGTANNKTGQSACTNCVGASSMVAGTYQPNTGQTACLVCPNGKYANGAKQSACTTCPTGRYCTGGKIIPCPAGKANNKTGQTVCTNCVASTASVTGTYSSGTGAVNCTACGNGYYTTGAGKTGCTICPAGSYCSSGKKALCAAGTANPSQGRSTACAACVAGGQGTRGTYANVAGKINCEYCTTGKTTLASNRTYCDNCPAGHYCPDGKKIPCPVGSYSVGGVVVACTSCGANMTTSGTGSTGAGACYSLWNCSTYGGTVSGSWCYRYTNVGACGGTNVGHTWAAATSAQVAAIQKTSVIAIRYTYSKYQGNVASGCYAYVPKAGYTTSGYYSKYQGYIAGSYVAPSASQQLTYTCPGTLCVTNN